MPTKGRGSKFSDTPKVSWFQFSYMAAPHLSRYQTCMWAAFPSSRAYTECGLHLYVCAQPQRASVSYARSQSTEAEGAGLRQHPTQGRDPMADTAPPALPGPTPSRVLGLLRQQRLTRILAPSSERARARVRASPASAPAGWAAGGLCCGAGTAAARRGLNRWGRGTRM